MFGCFEIKSDNVYIANIKQMLAVKLIANSAVVCIIALCFEHAQHFHISYFTYHLRYQIVTDHSWKLLTMF